MFVDGLLRDLCMGCGKGWNESVRRVFGVVFENGDEHGGEDRRGEDLTGDDRNTGVLRRGASL